MTWQGKRRKQLPGNWNTIRKRVLERDGYRCTATVGAFALWDAPSVQHNIRCTSRATEVHHAGSSNDHRPESLRSVCAYHHNLETQAEARQAQAKARAMNPLINRRLRPKPKHPGLM